MRATDPVRIARLAAELRDELAAVRLVVGEGAQALQGAASSPPKTLEIRGMAGILHDYYTGVERIFERVANELEGGTPSGPSTHRDLLRGACRTLPEIRPPVIQTGTARLLDEYLRFRHVFRNIYGYELEWARIAGLLERLPASSAALSTDLAVFFEFLDALATPTAGVKGT